MPKFSLNNILLIYKKSKYQIYFEEQTRTTGLEHISESHVARLIHSHEVHLRTLERVIQHLRERGLRFRPVYRARHVDYSAYDFVISVGGDGTLIEAARCIREQPLLGVNSDPERSVGHFCSANKESFAETLDAIVAGNGRTMNLNRIELHLDGQPLNMTVMNELLFAHHRPAAMSRYELRIGDRVEPQLSSGIWISTAAGSTGSIYSSGGKLMGPRSKRLQYLPREIFYGNGAEIQLKGGMIPANTPVSVRSHMRDGELSLDGCRCRVPMGYGQLLEIKNAPQPIRLVITGQEGIGQ